LFWQSLSRHGYHYAVGYSPFNRHVRIQMGGRGKLEQAGEKNESVRLYQGVLNAPFNGNSARTQERLEVQEGSA